MLRLIGLLLAPPAGVPADVVRLAADHLKTRPELSDRVLEPIGVEARRGRVFVRFRQTWQGVPVADRGAVVVLRGGAVLSVNDETAPLRRVAPATIDAEQARRVAAEKALGDPAAPTGAVTPIVIAIGDQGVPAFEVEVVQVPFQKHLLVRVDASDGRVAGVKNTVVR